MRIKKLMAMLLTAAMLMTSSSFTSVVAAAEPAETTAAVEETKETISETETVAADESDVAESGETTVEVSSDEKTEETVDVEDVAEIEESVSDNEIASVSDSEIEEEEIIEEEALDEEAEEAIYDDFFGDVEIAAAGDYFETDPAKCDTSGGKILLTAKTGITPSGVVTIPACVEVIPENTNLFKGNRSVEGIRFEAGCKLESIEEHAFEGSGVQRIYELPAAITEIKDNTFADSELTNITYVKESNIIKIGKSAFSGTNLTEVSFGYVTEVGANAFSKCINLSQVNLDRVRTIGRNAFEDCTSLSDGMNFSQTIENIGNYAFKNCGFTKLDFSDLVKLNCTEGTLNENKDDSPNGLGIGAFSYNSKLETVTIGTIASTRIQVIPSSCFANCKSLTKCSLNKAVTTIKGSAFENCTAISILDLAYVRTVNSKAYEGCSGLKEIKMSYYDEENPENHVIIDEDAFPLKTTLRTDSITMKGYDSAVEEYALFRGYKFVSLFLPKKINVVKELATVNVSNLQPHAGDIITVTVTTNSSVLRTIRYSYLAAPVQYPEFVGFDGNKLLFRFVMPDADVNLEVLATSNSKLTNAEMTFGFENAVGTEEKRPSKTDNPSIFTWDTRGYYARLKVYYNSDQYGNWAFDFTSSKPDKVAVTSDGVITGLANGSSVITITSKANKKKFVSFTVIVDNDDEVVIAKVDTGDGDIAKAQKLIDPGFKGVVSIDEITGYPVITLNKKIVASAAQTIQIDFEAYGWKDDDDHLQGYNNEKSYAVQSTWTSTDPLIATVASKISSTNSNTVTVRKGSFGETQIAISTINPGEKEPNGLNRDDMAEIEKEHNIGYVIIKVVDVTPRLANSNKIELNNQLINGVPLTIVPVYGYEISDDDAITVCTQKVENGIVSYEPSPDFQLVEYDPDNNVWNLKTSDSLDASLPLNKTLSYKNKLYLRGKFKIQPGSPSTVKQSFLIPIVQLTVTNIELKPKVTQVGRINMFYNRHADPVNELGSITLTQSELLHPVERYELVSIQNFANGAEYNRTKKKYESYVEYRDCDKPTNKMTKNGEVYPFDSMSYNFDIKIKENTVTYNNINNHQAVISRSEFFDDLAKVNNKNVVTGFIYIYFTEYKHPAKVPITINNINTAPVYYLSKTQATAHAEEKGQEYDLYLYPYGKANLKENAIDLTKAYSHDYAKDKDIYYIGFHDGMTKTNFRLTTKNAGLPTEDPGIQDKAKLDDNTICLKIPKGEYAEAGKCVISLHMTTWSDPDKYLFYNFTLNVTDKLTAKLTAASKTLNKAYTGGTDSQEILVYTSCDDAVIEYLEDLDYKATDKTRDSYRELEKLIDIDIDTPVKGPFKDIQVGKITIRQPDDPVMADKILNGKYVYTLHPTARMLNSGTLIGKDQDVDMKPISFSITVNKTNPTITVGGAFTLSIDKKVLTEKAVATCKIGNLLPGTTQVGDADAGIDSYEIIYADSKYTKGKDTYTNEKFKELVADVDYDAQDVRATAMKGNPAKKFADLTGAYTVSDVRVQAPGGAVAEAKPFRITIKSNKAVPTVVVKQTGKINMIVPSSSVVFTATLKNVQGDITGVGIREVNSNSRTFDDCRFDIEQRGNSVIVTVHQDKDLLYTDKDGKDILGDGYYKMKPDQIYRIQLFYGVSSMGGYTSEQIAEGFENDEKYYDLKTDTIPIIPTQVFPTLYSAIDRNYAFAGQDRTADEMGANPWDIKITVQVPAAFRGFSDVDETKGYINMTGIDWVPAMSKAVRDEFILLNGENGTPNTFKYYPKTGVAEIGLRLRNASEQRQNLAYGLVFQTKYEHQAEDTVGTRFGIVVNVNK